jgi:hypothetical protein
MERRTTKAKRIRVCVDKQAAEASKQAMHGAGRMTMESTSRILEALYRNFQAVRGLKEGRGDIR